MLGPAPLRQTPLNVTALDDNKNKRKSKIAVFGRFKLTIDQDTFEA